MSTHLKKTVQLLSKGTTEEAIAAAVVLGSLTPREKAVVDALARCLRSENNPPLALAAARALGRIGNTGALVALLPLLEAKGELRETGALAIAGCGRAAFPAVKRQLEQADFHTRNVLFRILSRMHSGDAHRLLLSFFFDENFEVVKMVGRALRGEVGSMTAAEKKATAKITLTFLKSKPVQDSRAVTNSTLIYLGNLAHTDAVGALLKHTAPKLFSSTRRHALNALRATLLGGTVPAKVVETVFPYLDDPDFESVVTPTLAILEKAEIPSGYERELRRLVGGRYPQVRQFAIRKLASYRTKTSAETLLDVMDGKDEELRRSAVRALKHSPQAPSLLFPRLLSETDPDRAWGIVHLLKPNAGTLKPAERKKLGVVAVKCLDKGERRAEALLHLYRHSDDKGYSKTFYDRALTHKRARRYADAERDLRLIAQSPHFDDDARFFLGLMMLKASEKDVTPSSPKIRQALEAFRRMAENPGFNLEARLKKESRTLGPEGLYSVGFGLVEGRGPTKSLGAKLLKGQVKKGPRTKVGRMAKAKLETEGLA
jgi:hypothetical protein